MASMIVNMLVVESFSIRGRKYTQRLLNRVKTFRLILKPFWNSKFFINTVAKSEGRVS